VEVNPKSGLASKLGFDGKLLDQPVSPKIVPDSERKKGDATVIADELKSIMDARRRRSLKQGFLVEKIIAQQRKGTSWR